MKHEDIVTQWPWARIELGMSRAEFDRLTLSELNDLRTYWIAKRKSEVRDRGELLYVIAASGGVTGPLGEPLDPQHFIPRWARKRVRRVPIQQQFLNTVHALGLTIEYAKPNGQQ